MNEGSLPDLSAGGLKVHFVSAPSHARSPAIVFLHGAGANHTIWLEQMKALREQAWVILPDLPGHGRSEEIPGLTIDEYASAMLPFLQALLARIPAGDERGLVLAGHSMGGAIALAAAFMRPSLFSGLVLVGTGARLGVSRDILEGLVEAPNETQALVARWSFASGADPALILRTMKDLAGTPARRTLADFHACNAFDVRDRVGEIALPVLLVCGREDRMTPPKYSEFLHDRIPRSMLRIIEGAGHGVMIEAPGAVSGAIGEFLALFRPTLL